VLIFFLISREVGITHFKIKDKNLHRDHRTAAIISAIAPRWAWTLTSMKNNRK
jgi:hypothetical protein